MEALAVAMLGVLVVFSAGPMSFIEVRSWPCVGSTSRLVGHKQR